MLLKKSTLKLLWIQYKSIPLPIQTRPLSVSFPSLKTSSSLIKSSILQMNYYWYYYICYVAMMKKSTFFIKINISIKKVSNENDFYRWKLNFWWHWFSYQRYSNLVIIITIIFFLHPINPPPQKKLLLLLILPLQ